MNPDPSVSETEDLEALHNELEDVERGLNERHGIWFSSGLTDRSGRSVFESVGIALGNFRERLHEMVGNSDSDDHGSNIEDRSRNSNIGSITREESLRVLSQRLSTAELSHSTRMPLNLLQREISRRDLFVNTEGASQTAPVPSSDESSPPTTRAAAIETAIETPRRSLQRRPSALLASRNRDDLSDVSAAMLESPSGGGSNIDSPSSPALARNLSDASFASGRNLRSSLVRSSLRISGMPILEEWVSPAEEGTEVSIEEYTGIGLLLPDSARKHEHRRPSMRGSLKILGDEVVRRLADEEDSNENEEDIETSQDKDGATPTTTIPDEGIYTWGSLAFNNSKGDADKEDASDEATYQLFGTSESAQASLVPRLLPSDTRLGRADVVSMSASETHCAFATKTGRLLICGNNREGAVDPSRRDSLCIPRPVHLEAGLAMNRIKKVSCGINHTAVITETRSVMTWGFNGQGQLGHRKSKRSNTSSFVSPKAFILSNGGRRADNVVCCDGFTLVLTTRMEAYVCGGEPLVPPKGGDPTKEGDDFFPLPQQNSVLRGLPLVGISSGLKHLVVWTAHGTAFAWGCNDVGQCGRECPRDLKVPVPIGVPKSTVTPIPNGSNSNSNSSVAAASFLKNWDVWARGEPMSLANDVHIVDAACGKDHTILVTDSGRLLVCGSNTNGQLGSVAKSPEVQSVAHPDPERRFQCAEAGTSHTLLLDDIGSVWQMGNGESSIKQVPSSSPLGSEIFSIAAGGSINFSIFKPKSEKTDSAQSIPSVPALDDLMTAIRLEHEQKKDPDSSQQQQVDTSKSYLSSIEDMARGTDNLFRSPAVMNSLFVDPKEIDHMYQQLVHGSHTLEMKQKIVSAIERGMTMGLKSMVDSRLIYFESVRFLLLYLQCPLWRDDEEINKSGNEEEKDSNIVFDSRGDLLFLLCETILGLPFEGYKAFLAWSSTVYGEELFVPLLVKPLVQQLNHRFKNNITHGIPMLAGVLRWLHTVNERSDDSLAKGEDFHCSGIDDVSMEALFNDLASYEMATAGERSSNFFLAANPFLMNPALKQRLLQVESQTSMVEAAQAEGVSFDSRTREFKFQPFFVLAIDRKHLLPQTLQAVAKASAGELRKGLKVVFKGEDGVDAGGVTKEFFQLLCEQLFDVNTGMWTTSFGSNNETWFNSDCTWNGEGYYLVGVLCGLAIYNSVILDVHFPHAIYRKLLGRPLGLEDLIDEDVRNGLKSLLDYDRDDAEFVFCLDFEVNWMDLGKERKKELKPGGSKIAVTSENKEEYVRLYVKWLLVDSIAAQYDEFERGFNRVMEDSSLDILLSEELELLVTGTPELDFSALEESAEYEGGFDENSALVQNIWKWIQSASLPTQEKFLRFCTGSSKGPIGGLGNMPFKIQRAGPDSQQLPTAHTCFNTLIVPDYGDDYDKMCDRLSRAVIECEGFGLQ